MEENLKDLVKEAITEMGLPVTVSNDANLKEFYKINRMDDNVFSKKVQVHKFDPAGDKISIVPITDLHHGHINSHRKKFEAFAEYILNTPDTYAIGLGDLMENATKTSIGLGIYDQDLDNEEQILTLSSMLKPLAKEGKLLGLHPGNHEYRTAVFAQLDPMKIVSQMIDVPFLGYQAYHKWTVGDQVYHAMSAHGRSAATTVGGRANAVSKMNQIGYVDVFMQGHTHMKHDHSDIIYYIDDDTNTLESKERHYVIGGSLLSYFGGYAEQSLLQPMPLGLVKIDLYRDVKQIKVYK